MRPYPTLFSGPSAKAGSPNASATVFMVEDNLALRDMVKGLIEGIPRLRWVGGCGTVAEARQALAEPHKPDIILLDLILPDGDGSQLLRAPAIQSGVCRVAITTGCQDEARVKRCEHPAVVGFIDKLTSRLVDWRSALQCLAEGRTYYSASFRRKH